MVRHAVAGLALTLAMIAALPDDASAKRPMAKAPPGLWRAPGFSVPAALGGGPVTLARHAGKVRIVNCWAPWCGPCKAEIPALVDLQRRYSKRGFTVIGVALAWNDPASVVEVARANGVNYPLGLGDESVKAAYGVQAFPTTLVVGRKGYVYKRYRGTQTMATLEADIQALL